MKTEAELWAEYDRLFEAEDYEAAGKILDLIPPVSDDEWLGKLSEAPLDDEPVSPRLQRELDEFHRRLEARSSRHAG